MTANSNSKSRARKRRRKGDRPPRKPYADFVLYAHCLGYWSAKRGGKILHFGRWARQKDGVLRRLPYDAGWREALANYKARFEDVQMGRVQTTVVSAADEPVSTECTLGKLCDHFLAAKRELVDTGEISALTFTEYQTITDLLIGEFGARQLAKDLVAADFQRLRAAMSKRWGPLRLGHGISRTKSIFKWGFETEMLNVLPRYGPSFKKPTAAVLRRHRAQTGQRTLSPEECRKLIDAADVQMRSMILLALNCGFGGHDCASLPLSAVDLESAMIDFARPKTGVARRCPLWQETVKSLQDVIATRPKPRHKDAEPLVFVRRKGTSWLCNERATAVGQAARILMKKCGVKKPGVNFYVLRHVHRTISDGARDQVAAAVIMGHTSNDMSSHYREYVSDDRLIAVTDCVRRWLFADTL